MKKEAAFSGLEAAIVLIAFVVVAAVFSYVMLGAGFFATQKSQEVTYSGIKQATSNLVVDGQVYGNTAPVSRVEFNIAIAEGGQPQLLSGIDFVTTVDGGSLNPDATVEFADKEGNPVAGTTVLDAGDKVLAKVTMTPAVPSGHTFTIEMKPKVGAATLLSKTLGTGYTNGIIL